MNKPARIVMEPIALLAMLGCFLLEAAVAAEQSGNSTASNNRALIPRPTESAGRVELMRSGD